MCQGGEEIELLTHIFLVQVSRGNVVGEGKQCICTLGVVF